MGPPPGVTLVPTTRQSICGTGIIQECPRLKSALEAIIRQVPTTTIPTLTITLIMGHLHLYRTIAKTAKTQAPPAGLWIQLCNISLDQLTAGGP